MIEVENLNLTIRSKQILENISFQSHKNLGIIGASGSGKTSLMKCFIKLFEKNTLSAKLLKVQGQDILKEQNLSKLRSNIALIFQDAKASFYPHLDIGRIFNITLKTHTRLDSKQIKRLAFEHFERLNLEKKELIWHSYAHELSGGMAMRVQIALVLACGAKMLLCDELNSFLDEKNSKALIELLKDLKLNLVLSSHDLHFIKELSDEILVLERGKVAEFALKEDFFKQAKSAYAKELLRDFNEA
ncbi:ABC transporter ATP-binding protein [Campylobacter sp. MIT 99-7217]|uniref:ATP-binding cassette domain-containing protein n=1 Tax=Campylobacter sp. MIT 99-7217 TaxID=535091 RepID=UPI00115A552F|nr:ATP-binding cassette domain-containing protein [Campylobacter sp. MIT 99-7217]TQR32416.1 ABC transporter ATP-binding protein [Campylobacter sp. MIT 99-7217]